MPKKKSHDESAHAPEEELQQKYIQLQVMKQQAQSFFEEKQKLDNHLSEMSLTLDAMKKLTETKADEEIFLEYL